MDMIGETTLAGGVSPTDMSLLPLLECFGENDLHTDQPCNSAIAVELIRQQILCCAKSRMKV
jgi:hypothetical protein